MKRSLSAPNAAIKRPSSAPAPLVDIPNDLRGARAAFAAHCKDMGIKIGHSIFDSKSREWKSLTPEAMRAEIKRRRASIHGSQLLEEWAQRTRIANDDELGAVYFCWYHGVIMYAIDF